jgi:hypothetical protein
LATIHTAVQAIAFLAGIVLLVAALLISIPVALQPAKWPRKLLYAIPVFIIILALIGVVFNLTGIGSGSFAGGWLGVGALLTALTLVIAAYQAHLGIKTLQAVSIGTGITGILSAIGWIGLAIMLVFVSTNQPSFGRGGEFGGAGRPERPGGFEGAGGPGGVSGAQSFRIVLIAGVILLAILAAALLFMYFRSRLAMRSKSAEDEVRGPLTSYGHQIGPTLLALLGVGVIFLLAIQLVPVSRVNPPVQTTLQWDSPTTQDLATRACMDCHSNQTRWPWYSTIAPGSWLTAIHVNDGRRRLNFSELGDMSTSQKARLAEEVAQQIRNGSMPTSDYLLIHPDARLTDAQKQQLIQGFQNTLSK